MAIRLNVLDFLRNLLPVPDLLQGLFPGLLLILLVGEMPGLLSGLPDLWGPAPPPGRGRLLILLYHQERNNQSA